MASKCCTVKDKSDMRRKHQGPLKLTWTGNLKEAEKGEAEKKRRNKAGLLDTALDYT